MSWLFCHISVTIISRYCHVKSQERTAILFSLSYLYICSIVYLWPESKNRKVRGCGWECCSPHAGSIETKRLPKEKDVDKWKNNNASRPQNPCCGRETPKNLLWLGTFFILRGEPTLGKCIVLLLRGLEAQTSYKITSTWHITVATLFSDSQGT